MLTTLGLPDLKNTSLNKLQWMNLMVGTGPQVYLVIVLKETLVLIFSQNLKTKILAQLGPN